MAPTSRIVFATWYRAGLDLDANAQITYQLHSSSYTGDALISGGTIIDTANSEGESSTELWTNLEGYTPTTYTVTFPSGKQFTFHLPAGDDPISLPVLLASYQAGEWHPRIIQDLFDDFRDEIYAAFANTTTLELGDALIGYRANETGAVGRTVHDKLLEVLSVKDFGAVGDGTTDDTAAIQAAITAAMQRTPTSIVEIDDGDYAIKSQTGVGVLRASLIALNAEGLTVRGRGKGRLLLQDGCAVRPILFRYCDDLVVEGLTVIDQRTAAIVGGKAQPRVGNGIGVENSNRVRVRNNWVEGCGTYGYVLCEDTSTFIYRSALIHFDGPSQRIFAPPSGFIPADGTPGPQVGDRIYQANSVYNNGFNTVVAVDPSGGWIQVDQVEDNDVPIVTESAGFSIDSVTDDTISTEDSTMTSVNAAFRFLRSGDVFTLSGDADNNGTYVVATDGVAEDFQSVTITGTFVTKAAGALITITKIARPQIQVWRGLPCNDVQFTNNTAVDCELYGFELFPKDVSRNLRVTGNVADRCGLGNTAGTGIKAGSNQINAYIAFNTITRGQMGMNLGNFRATLVEGNTITNCNKWGIAITMSSHLKAPQPVYGTLTVRNNLIAFSTDQDTGELFQATNENGVPISGMPAININGLVTNVGLLEICNNTIYKWGANSSGYGSGGIQFNKSYVATPNIKIHHNTMIDCGAVYTVPLEGYSASTSLGSTLLTAITNPAGGTTTPTAGWLEEAEIVGATTAPGVTITDVNVVLNRMTMSAAATAFAFSTTTRNGSPLCVMPSVARGKPAASSPITGTGIPGSTTVSSVLTPLVFTGTTTDTSNNITAVASTAGLYEGSPVTGAGIPAGSVITSVSANSFTINANATISDTNVSITANTNSFVLSANATASGTITATANNATNVALRSGIPFGVEVTDNKFISTADYSNQQLRLYSNNGRIHGNWIKGFGPYPVQVLGSTLWITGNKVIEPNQLRPVPDDPEAPWASTAGRGPFLLGTTTDPLGVYHVSDNEIDLGATGGAAYIANTTNVGAWYPDNNRTTSTTIQLINSGGVAPSYLTTYVGTKRQTKGSSAPTSGAWSGGDECINDSKTQARFIDKWVCVVAGTPGTWNAEGIGSGSTTTRNGLSLTANDAGYMYWNTSVNQMQRWNGTAWYTSSTWTLVV